MTTETVETQPHPESFDTRHRVGVYGWSPGSGGVHFYRIGEPLRVLADHGVVAGTGVALSDEILSTVDTILVHTLHGEQESEAWEDLARLDTHRLVIDIDDWMWNPDHVPFKRHYTPDVLARLFRNIELAHVVTTPSPRIAEYLHQYNRNVWVVPNTVPAWVLGHTMPARQAPTIGWQCSPSHLADFTPSFMRGIGTFMGEHPDWVMHVYGPWNVQAVDGSDQARIRNTQWIAGVDNYLRTLSLDIGLGPLLRTPFNAAKSSLRAVEYSALGIIPVLPDSAIYRDYVAHGETGWLIPHSLLHDDRALARTLAEAAQPIHRMTMAAAARTRAAAWTTETNIGRWLDAWNSQ